jgi:hypothetical protein
MGKIDHAGNDRPNFLVESRGQAFDIMAIMPGTWRHVVSATSTKLHGMGVTAWDSNLWHLAYWYREAGPKAYENAVADGEATRLPPLQRGALVGLPVFRGGRLALPLFRGSPSR